MTNLATQTLATVAALFLTISSIGAIVTVPPAQAGSISQTAELA